MKRKRKQLNTYSKILCILLLILIIIVLKFFFNKDNTKNNDNNINDYTSIYNEFITDQSESDKDIINEIFADGLNINDYKKILIKGSDYISENGNYKTIEYDFDRKLHYSEIEEMIYNFNNSDIVNVEIIGKSVDNRNIYGIEVGNGNDAIYMDANIHAAETANTLILTRFLTEIIDKYENDDSSVKNVLNNIKIAVILTINPDGYEVYNFGVESLNNKQLWWYKNKDNVDFENIKSNANGVDLNRNFPTQNAGLYYNGKNLLDSVSLEKTTKGLTYFGGYSLGSEPETKASMYFMLKHHKNTIAYINFHSQGRVIYAGKPNLSDDFNNATVDFANRVSYFNNYHVHGLSSEEVGEGNDGSATDFMAELANGLVFSSKTGRLSSKKYIEDNYEFKYEYPVITLETIKTYTTDPSYYKDEYYNHGLRDMLFDIINNF